MSRVVPPGDWLERILPRLERFVDLHPGLMLENKKLSLALHYRGRPDLEKVVQEFVAELELPTVVERLQGRKVVDPRRRRLRRRTPPYGDGETPQDQAPRRLQGPQVADGVSRMDGRTRGVGGISLPNPFVCPSSTRQTVP